MTFQSNQGNERFFNNADSFAMVFDEHWKKHNSNKLTNDQNIEEKLDLIFNEIKEHPFLLNQPEQAKEVAMFRIRLLNL